MSIQGGPVDDVLPPIVKPQTSLKPVHVNFVKLRLFDLILLITILSFALKLIFDFVSMKDQLFIPISLLVILTIFTILRDKAYHRYEIIDKGLLVSDFWFSQRLISWGEFVDLYIDSEVTDERGEIEGIRIILDTPWLLINKTGLQAPNLFISRTEYDKEEFDRFFDELQRIMNKRKEVPATLNQRLINQVDRAWDGRFKRIFTIWVDNFSEVTYYFLALYLVMGLFFGYTNLIWVFSILWLGYGLFAFVLIYLIHNPYSIVGIRPNELGAVQYLPDDGISNIRFVVYTKPYSIQLEGCSLTYSEDSIKQFSNLVQIHPKSINPGELAHGVAQITGNQSKAVGATIQFTQNESELVFKVPISWD